MNTVERVKELCKERGVRIAKLERDCGFANGYISQLKKGTMPDDRIAKIAEYFNVTIEYLCVGEKTNQQAGYYINNETAAIAQQIFENRGMRTLFDAARDSKPEDLKMAAELLARLKGTNPDA